MTTPQSEASHRALATKESKTPLTGERLISRAEVRQFVSASDMGLWRWLQAKKFPPPLYIGARRYWKASDIARWLESKEVQNGAS